MRLRDDLSGSFAIFMPALILGREGRREPYDCQCGVLKPQSSLAFRFVNVSSVFISIFSSQNLQELFIESRNSYRQNGGKKSCPRITQLRAGVQNPAARHRPRTHGSRSLRHHLLVIRRRRLDPFHRTTPFPAPPTNLPSSNPTLLTARDRQSQP